MPPIDAYTWPPNDTYVQARALSRKDAQPHPPASPVSLRLAAVSDLPRSFVRIEHSAIGTWGRGREGGGPLWERPRPAPCDTPCALDTLRTRNKRNTPSDPCDPGHKSARSPRDAAREAHDPCNCRHRVRGISEIPPAIPAIPATNLHDPLAIPRAKLTIPVTVVTHCPLL